MKMSWQTFLKSWVTSCFHFDFFKDLSLGFSQFLQLQYWEPSLAELGNSSLGLELVAAWTCCCYWMQSASSRHRSLTSSVDLLPACRPLCGHRDLSPGGRNLSASSHPTVLAPQVAWITGECQISRLTLILKILRYVVQVAFISITYSPK